MTLQREVILEETKKVSYHPTADEIYERVKKRLPRISLGTIYRNLEILASQGMIQKVEIGAGTQKRFDGNTQPHYHIRCIHCGALEDVWIQPLPIPEEVFQDPKGYEIWGLELEFTGLCPKCRKSSS
jgi:Fur family ferric uptake transcriptional regulator